MLKNKKLYLSGLLLFLSVILIVSGISLREASSTQDANPEIAAGNKADIPVFSDVNETDWFFSDVEYVCSNKLMNGTSNTTFEPNVPTTRGMIVTILWRLEGEPDPAEKNTFSDVTDGSYYCDAVAWAAENKIVSGYDDGLFGPEDNITREQLATIFCRYAAYKEYNTSADASLEQYKDFNKISEYAIEAFRWANSRNIITGTSSDTLSPQGDALRCQAAAILRRFIEQFAEEKTDVLINIDNESDSGKQSGSIGGNGGYYVKDESSDSGEEDTNANLPKIKIGNMPGLPGEQVQVTAEVENNPGILGMILQVEYDESALKLESVENGEAVAEVLNMTPSAELKSGSKFVWDGLEISSEQVKDGAVLRMNFSILGEAAPGTYPIALTYADGDIVDGSLRSISLPIEPGSIRVK